MSPYAMYLLRIQAVSGSERERQVAAVYKTPALQISHLQAHLWFSRNSSSAHSDVGTAVSGSGGARRSSGHRRIFEDTRSVYLVIQ